MQLSLKSLVRIGISAMALIACAPARTKPVPPEPEPAAAPAPAPAAPAPAPAAPTPAPATPPPATATAPIVREAPRNWQLLDGAADRVPGISAERALREVLAGKQPKRTVVVAVLDGGVDTSHVDLKDNFWKNPKEVAGNGVDDDRNGYVDDVHGWNFIGGRDGQNVHHDTWEVTRLHARCTARSQGGRADTLPEAEQRQCEQVSKDLQEERTEAEQLVQQVGAVGAALSRATQILGGALGTDSLTAERVTALKPTSLDLQQARQIYLQLSAQGITADVVEEARTSLQSQLQYGLNPSFEPRAIVGDDYADLAERQYGNADVTGPDADHGTHVAGIIAAERANGIGVDGIAPAVRIMSVRTVPDGDERDKDVANAIRYAVDNGAHIINMSFGKAYSPGKRAVDEAVKYADARGVLMVHGAGNDGEDVSQKPSFPTPQYDGGGAARHWIEVGASSWHRADSLAAPFSNYSADRVDVFAPGVDILSTTPESGYKRQSGTSMAAPVVAGLAALLMAYYPELTAADVRHIILSSATSHADQMVVRPGSTTGEQVRFGALSATGGVVNAYAAVRMAEDAAKSK